MVVVVAGSVVAIELDLGFGLLIPGTLHLGLAPGHCSAAVGRTRRLYWNQCGFQVTRHWLPQHHGYLRFRVSACHVILDSRTKARYEVGSFPPAYLVVILISVPCSYRIYSGGIGFLACASTSRGVSGQNTSLCVPLVLVFGTLHLSLYTVERVLRAETCSRNAAGQSYTCV